MTAREAGPFLHLHTMHVCMLALVRALFVASLSFCYLPGSFSGKVYASIAQSIVSGEQYYPLGADLLQKDPISTSSGLASGSEEDAYLPEFPSMERSITARQAHSALKNNEPGKMNISLGETQFWIFPEKDLGGSITTPVQRFPLSDYEDVIGLQSSNQMSGAELKKRQTKDRKLFITLSICSQPAPLGSGESGRLPPPLELFISYGADNKFPGPASRLSEGHVSTNGGLTTYADRRSGDSYFGVHAPSTPDFKGAYSYEITASIDAPYTDYQETPGLFHVDSDTHAGLFVTNNLTVSNASDALTATWLASGSPFSVFVYDRSDANIVGLERSYCCMTNHAPIKGNIKGMDNPNVEVGMSTLGDGGLPKQQFYVKNLNAGSAHSAVLAWETNYTQTGSSKVGLGGVVWPVIHFTTKSDAVCQLIYNLSFCNTVSYAVPSNPARFPNMSSLATAYDQNAQAYYQNFSNSLDQVPCDTISSAQYSLAATCADCATAYKRWLCAVTIPRCVDFSTLETYLVPRRLNATFPNGTDVLSSDGIGLYGVPSQFTLAMNTSRNPFIDIQVQPGPYKELLPCKDLCYGLVQFCPSSLQFACPLEGQALSSSYNSGKDANNNSMCNKPGAVWGTNAAPRMRPSRRREMVALSLVILCGIMGDFW